MGAYDVPAESFGLTGDDAAQYNFAANVGEFIPLLVNHTEQPSLRDPLPVSVNPGMPARAITRPTVITPVLPIINPNKNTSDQKKGPKDLIQEAKAAQQKKADAAAREAKRKEASAQGKVKEGKSNQEVKGDHNTNQRGSNSDAHDARIRRAKREQKAAEKAAKKKPN